MVRQSARRDGGSGLVVILLVVTILLAFSAALTMTSLVGVRSINSSEAAMQAFYHADSGAQAAIAQIRASNGTLLAKSIVEKLGAGTASVGITIPSINLYRILSTSTVGSETKTVEVYLQFTGLFGLGGAIALDYSKGTVVEKGGIRVGNNLGTMVSGFDHDETGALSLDQSGAVFGLSMPPLPGGENFTLMSTGTVEGAPTAMTNTATGNQAMLTALCNNAKTGADVSISGSRTLGDADNGLYGTAAAPKLVYAQLGMSDCLTLTQSFTGYGTLVIDAANTKNFTSLTMNSFASWYGLVLVYFSDDKAAQKEGTFVALKDSARIVGGLSLFFNTDKSKVKADAVMVQLSNSASVLYSKSLIKNARGTENVSTKSGEVISYRIP